MNKEMIYVSKLDILNFIVKDQKRMDINIVIAFDRFLQRKENPLLAIESIHKLDEVICSIEMFLRSYNLTVNKEKIIAQIKMSTLQRNKHGINISSK